MEDRKARFHKVMAEHYANGGSVDGDQIFFGHEDFLSQDGEDKPPAGDPMDNEMGDPGEMGTSDKPDIMAMRKKRLRSSMMG